MNVLDLFSGIGGFSLGLERAGMKTVAFCEIEPYCRAVLKKHWPDVRIYEDVKQLTAARLAADGISVDVICGGFPCQDISYAGKGTGLEGERSGLWYEFHRLIKEIKPQYAIIENVSALRSRGLDQVLWSLAKIGYDAEWHCIPASAVGAPHRRDRIWIIAYPQADIICANSNCSRPHFEKIYEQREIEFRDKQIGIFRQMGDYVANTDNTGSRTSKHDVDSRWSSSEQRWKEQPFFGAGGFCEAVADPNNIRIQQYGADSRSNSERNFSTRIGGNDRSPRSSKKVVADPNGAQRQGRWLPSGAFTELTDTTRRGWWEIEPDVGRVAHGVPARVDRLRALGNAVVPQIPEIIGRAIIQQHQPS